MVYMILVILIILPLDIYSQSEKIIFGWDVGVYLVVYCGNPKLPSEDGGDCDTYLTGIGYCHTEINPTKSDFKKRYSGLLFTLDHFPDLDIERVFLRVYQDVSFHDSLIIDRNTPGFKCWEDDTFDITPGFIDYNGEIQYNKYWCELPLKYITDKTERKSNYFPFNIDDKYYDKYGKSSNRKNKLPGRLVGYHKNTFKHHPRVFTIVEIIKDGEIIYRGGFLLNKNGYNG